MQSAALAACLAYLIVRPVSHGAVLYPVLALMLVLSLWRLSNSTRPARREFAYLAGCLLLAIVIAVVVGWRAGNPGLIHQSIMWFGAPLVWGTWAASLEASDIRLAARVVTGATIAMGVFALVVGAGRIGILPAMVPRWLLDEWGARYGARSRPSALRFYGLSSLAGAAPFLVAGLMTRRSEDRSAMPRRRWLALAFALCLVMAVLGGRRSIVAVTVASPLIAGTVWWALAGPERRRAIRHTMASFPQRRFGLAATIVGVTGFAIGAAAGLGQLQRGFGIVKSGVISVLGLAVPRHGNADDAIRADEARRLLDAWREAPLFGHGLGARIDGYARSTSSPWSFELQYHAWLFVGGVVGVVLLVVALGWGWRLIRVAAARTRDLPMLVASVSAATAMLIVNAYDPFLQAVGHWWPVALALGVCNWYAGEPAPDPAPDPVRAR